VARHISGTTGDREQTLGLYRRALQLDPQFALAHADMARFYASRGDVARSRDEWRNALAIPQRLSPQEKLGIELMLMQHDGPDQYFRKAEEYLALYPDDYRIIGRLAVNQWHQRNDFRAAENLVRRTIRPQFERAAASRDALGTFLLGQEKYDAAIVEYRAAKAAGYLVWGEFHARVFDVRGQHAEADKVYLASTNGRDGWRGEGGVVTWIDRGQWADAVQAAQAWAAKADAEGDALESIRARTALASVAVLSNRGDASAALRNLQATLDAKGAAADDVYPPTTTEVRLYIGLLAAYRGNRAGVDEALRRTLDSQVLRDYPTVAQLQQVLLAEQERLTGKPQAAAARLMPLVKRDTALVAVHWALMRAAQASGDENAAKAEASWLVSHRGRVFTESTTTEVLRFFNVVVSADALKTRGGKPLNR
jgi:thioredoxin-like negative regulator of GroEL